jgi:hypothetical protein
MAKNLTAQERRRKVEQALNLKAMGLTNVSIADRIGVNRKTVPGLLEQAAEGAEDSRFLEAARAKTHYSQIIRTCWTKLRDKNLSVNSHNIPALIGLAASAQARLDKLNVIEAPQRFEVEEKMTLADYARKVNGVPREQRLRIVD